MDQWVRIVSYQTDPARVRDFVYYTETFVVPLLRRRAGFDHGYWLADPENGRTTALTLWSDREAIDITAKELSAFHEARSQIGSSLEDVRIFKALVECAGPGRTEAERTVVRSPGAASSPEGVSRRRSHESRPVSKPEDD